MSARNPTQRVDVAVVGAGPAGLAAAVAAALEGASVALVDRGPETGGNVGNAFVHTICGLYEAGAGSAGAPRLANAGLANAFAASLGRIGAAGEPERVGRLWVLPIDPRGVSALASALCAGTPGLSAQVGRELCAAEARSDGFALELCDSQRNRYGIDARVAIDASGDGDLAWATGADTECEGPEGLQHPSFIVALDGVDPVELAGFERVRTTAAVAHAARSGELPPECQSVVVRPAAFGGAASRAFLTFTFPKPEPDATGRGAYDPCDAGQRRALHLQACERAEQVVAYLAGNRPGFAEARIVRFPARIGVREGRRVVGRVVLDRAHVVEGRSHPDEVARSSWPIELWHAPSGARFEHPAGSCAIPLGALTSRTHARLGTAGRCLSATHEAHGALRVVATALATGEAIGLAAALACRAGTTLAAVAPAAVREARARIAPRLAERLHEAETRCVAARADEARCGRAGDRAPRPSGGPDPRTAAWGSPPRGRPGPPQV